MRLIESTFSRLKEKGQAAYIPYVCTGDPSLEFTLKLVERLAESGADIIELGLPFSDPIADGAAIQRAMNRALRSGFKVDHIFQMIESIRKSGIEQPIVLMSYLNPILRIGPEDFCEHLADSGGNGLLVVDMPIEESDTLKKSADNAELDMIQLIAPTSDENRIDSILSIASGFVYVVSVAGTTGARDKLPDSAISTLRRVVPRAKIPVTLGFGISTPQHVKEAVAAGASGVIEGSKLISFCEEEGMSNEASLQKIAQHVTEMKNACFH